MQDFRDKIAVITGAGSGMGRELALQLVQQGAHVAICDVFEDSLAETERACRSLAAPPTRILAQRCDVADEAQVLSLRDRVQQEFATTHINLLFNNAGIGGGASFIKDSRANWERTFAVCWFGVYYCSRAFLPLLIASSEGCIVNTSSVNGFYAVSGQRPHTAYSTAKFAVKGFSEALYTDLRVNAPHVKVALVMPGHIGTSIVPNTIRAQGYSDPTELVGSGLQTVRSWLVAQGIAVEALNDEQVRATALQRVDAFRANAPMSAAEAATVILEGVRAQRWRILVGADAERLDQIARTDPDHLYDPETLQRVTAALQELRDEARAKRPPIPA